MAAGLVDRALADRRLRARWAVCDEGFGADQQLRAHLAARGLWYLAEVACDTKVWPLAEPDGQTARRGPQTWVPPQVPSRRGPVPRRARRHPASPATVAVSAWAAQVPPERWPRYRLLEGSQGPLVAEFVAVRVVLVQDRLPGAEGWLVVRRTLSEPGAEPVYKHSLGNAPAATPLPALVRVSGMRWPHPEGPRSGFTEGKGALGLDHDELRSWRGWHHHLTLVILAQHFLVRRQQRLNQRAGGRRSGDHAAGRPGRLSERGRRDAGAPAAGGRAGQPGRGVPAAAGAAAAAGVGPGGGAGVARVPATPQGGGVSLPSQA